MPLTTTGVSRAAPLRFSPNVVRRLIWSPGLTRRDAASAALTRRESGRERSAVPEVSVMWERNPGSTAKMSGGTPRMLTPAADRGVTRRPVPCRSGTAATTPETPAIDSARLCMSASGVPDGRDTWTWYVPTSRRRAVIPSIMPVETSITTISGTRLRAMPITEPRKYRAVPSLPLSMRELRNNASRALIRPSTSRRSARSGCPRCGQARGHG